MRKALSPAEALLWGYIKSGALGVTVRRQYPVGPYFLDFYVPAAKLCIEIDGSTHERTAKRDEERDRYLLTEGITTMRFTASELSKDSDSVVRTILTYIEDYRKSR